MGIVSRSYITALENGRIRPTAENLKMLAERLGKPLSYFMPDKLEEAVRQLETLLNQTKVYLALGENQSASDVFQVCHGLHVVGWGIRRPGQPHRGVGV